MLIESGVTKKFIQKTFTLATSSISINGLAYPSSSLRTLQKPKTSASGTDPKAKSNSNADEEEAEEGDYDEEHYEPHSTTLAQKCQSLSSTLEQETLELCMLRREAPEKAAREWRVAYEEGAGSEEKSAEEGRKKLEELVQSEVRPVKDVRLQRQVEVEESWKVARSGLEGLRGGLTGTRARLERAGDAVRVLEEKR
jgi:hypothetical protein